MTKLPATDNDMPTLHIRCGSDILDTLRQAGFQGEFLEYSDPVSEGPVPDGPALLEVRARYLADAFGGALRRTEADILAGSRAAEERLAEAHRFERVVLWFEHDSYDQLVLARCLSRLAEGTLPSRLELICIDSHPSVPRFLGLGQLGVEALAGLWPTRMAVTPAQIALGQAVWAALRSANPSGLETIARDGTQALPFAMRALWRHLRELPGTEDGLSLTQRLALSLLHEAGPMRIGQMFAAMVQGREPLVFMGDLGFLRTVETMACTGPVLRIGDGDAPFPRVATLTEIGRKVLAGEVDYLSLGPEERWVGGVRVGSGWRFNEAAGGVCQQP